TAGCFFLTPLPLPLPVAPNLTACILNSYLAPASGTLDLATGTSSVSLALVSDVYLTGNFAQPCPACRSGGVPVSGSPSSPATGTCDRGPRAGLACVSTNSTGLSRDCLTGGVDGTHPCTGGNPCIDGFPVGSINVDVTPLTTHTVAVTQPSGN